MKTLLFDDVRHSFEVPDEVNSEIFCKSYFEFQRFLEITLSEDQFENFIGDETKREFSVKNKKFALGIAYLEGEDNPFHDSRKAIEAIK